MDDVTCRQFLNEGHPYHHVSPVALRSASLSSRVASCAVNGILIITCRQLRCEWHPYHHVLPVALRRASLSSRVASCAVNGILVITCRQLRCEGHPYAARLSYVCINCKTGRNPKHSKTGTQTLSSKSKQDCCVKNGCPSHSHVDK